MADRPIAYEGKEPYIFISYAHKDTKEVYEVLNELQKKDYRFWYDDGIAPGSEWPENIAAHLNSSSLCMAFITPNSMGSVNCRREINFALSKNIPFLGIILRETEMPLGMEMQLSAQQSILKYNYRTNEEFIQKILTCPDIQVCKKKPEPVVEVTHEVSTTSSASATMQAKTTVNAAVPETQKTVVANRTPVATSKLKMPLLIGGAALIAVIAIVIAVSGKGGKSTSDPENVANSSVQAEIVTESAQGDEEKPESTEAEKTVEETPDAAVAEKSENSIPSILQVYVDSDDNKLCGNWADGDDRLSFGTDHTYAFHSGTGDAAYGTWNEEDGKLILKKEELFGTVIEGGTQETSYSMITDDMLSIAIGNKDLTLSRTNLEEGGAWAVYYQMTPVTDLDVISSVWTLQVNDDTLPSRITPTESSSDAALLLGADNGKLTLRYGDQEKEYSYELVKGGILMVDGKPYFSSDYNAQDPVNSLYLKKSESYYWKAAFGFEPDAMLEVFFPSFIKLSKDGICQVISRNEVTYDGTWTVEDDKFSMKVDVNGETKEFNWTAFNNGTSLFLSDGETTVRYDMGGTVHIAMVSVFKKTE